MPFTKTFHGYIENSTDTLLIVEACRSRLLPTINRRLVERERNQIKSGTIIVFNESESGIKRWTDGFLWSPSRILGNFLVYRELANREQRRAIGDYDYPYSNSSSSSPNALFGAEREHDLVDEASVIHLQRERALVGSLTTSNTTYNFKKNGLIKKTIRIMVNGNYLHIVSYYTKHDVLNNLLLTPSASPELACLQISADLIPHLQGSSPSGSANFPLGSLSTTAGSRKRSQSSSCSSEATTNNNVKYSRPSSNTYAHNEQHRSHQQRRDNYYDTKTTGYSPSTYANIPNMLPTTTAVAAQRQQQSAPVSGGGGYSTYYTTSTRPSMLDSNNAVAAPFTELPPPLSQHNNDFSHATHTTTASRYVPRSYDATTAFHTHNSKYKLFTTTSTVTIDALLSPSPSPTSSPPTTLPILGQAMMTATTENRYYHAYYDTAVITTNNVLDSSNDHYNSYRHNRSVITSSLDNY